MLTLLALVLLFLGALMVGINTKTHFDTAPMSTHKMHCVIFFYVGLVYIAGALALLYMPAGTTDTEVKPRCQALQVVT